MAVIRSFESRGIARARLPSWKGSRSRGLPRRGAKRHLFAVLLCIGGGAACADDQTTAVSQLHKGELANGAEWVLEMPAAWNGTLIIVSRGYFAGPGKRTNYSLNDSLELQHRLLSEGYAFIGSSYSANGWAVEEGMADQMAVLDLFEERFGSPQTVIAFGKSMGGLISIGMVEKWPDRIHGAMPVCASASGSVPMMNVALDGMFVVKTLLNPGIRIVTPPDENADRALAARTVSEHMETPEGRARLTLAAALAQIPDWTTAESPPAENDIAGRQREMLQSFLLGSMLPRGDQERRAGGNFSWNVGVDYTELLDRSGQRALVEQVYREAGLDLTEDLRKLNNAERITADPDAAAYMEANYVPTGDLQRPVLLMHTLGDGMTVPALTTGFATRVARAGKSDLLRRLYVERAGHCTFTSRELEIGLKTLLTRIRTGQWPETTAAHLNRSGGGRGDAATAFTDRQPPTMTRPESTLPLAR